MTVPRSLPPCLSMSSAICVGARASRPGCSINGEPGLLVEQPEIVEIRVEVLADPAEIREAHRLVSERLVARGGRLPEHHREIDQQVLVRQGDAHRLGVDGAEHGQSLAHERAHRPDGRCGTGGFSGCTWPHGRHVRSSMLASKRSMAALRSFSMSPTGVVTSWIRASQRSQNQTSDSVCRGARLISTTSPHVSAGRCGACGVRAGTSIRPPSRMTCSYRRPPSMYSSTMSPLSM